MLASPEKTSHPVTVLVDNLNYLQMQIEDCIREKTEAQARIIELNNRFHSLNAYVVETKAALASLKGKQQLKSERPE